MDRERLGRALGAGTRGAAATLARIADAALAPNPHGQAAPKAAPQQRVGPGQRPARRTSVRDRLQAMWSPAARASRVLWLELTGSFFALFALAMAIETWKRRAGFLSSGRPREYAWIVALLLLVFAWFAVSSFVEASRRSRR